MHALSSWIQPSVRKKHTFLICDSLAPSHHLLLSLCFLCSSPGALPQYLKSPRANLPQGLGASCASIPLSHSAQLTSHPSGLSSAFTSSGCLPDSPFAHPLHPGLLPLSVRHTCDDLLGFWTHLLTCLSSKVPKFLTGKVSLHL